MQFPTFSFKEDMSIHKQIVGGGGSSSRKHHVLLMPVQNSIFPRIILLLLSKCKTVYCFQKVQGEKVSLLLRPPQRHAQTSKSIQRGCRSRYTHINQVYPDGNQASLHHFFFLGSCSRFRLQIQGLKLPNSRFPSLVVNCVMGWSRSATIVAAYLMMKQGMSSAEALQTIRQSRPIRPNPGFLQQLADHENLLNKKPFWQPIVLCDENLQKSTTTTIC